MQSWQLQQAKAHLSDVVRRAKAEGPQEISVRGEPSVVVLSQEDYQLLMKPHPRLTEFMRKSPLAGQDINFTRDQTPDRDLSL